MLGRGGGFHLATLPALCELAWPGTGVLGGHARRREFIYPPEGGRAFGCSAAAVGAVGFGRGQLAPTAPCPTSVPPVPAPVGTAAVRLDLRGDPQSRPSRIPAPTSTRADWQRGRRVRPPGGDLLKSGPRPPLQWPRPRLASAPPTAPWLLPFLPASSRRPPARLGPERSPLLPSAAPPRLPPRPSRAGGPKTRSAGARLRRARAAALGMLSSRDRFFGRK